MLKYLAILLDDTSVAYCHAENPFKKRNLIPIESLRRGILWGMKENLMIQFVYPDYDLPEEYLALIDSIDHSDTYPLGHKPKSTLPKNDAISLAVADYIPTRVDDQNLVIRLPFMDVLHNYKGISQLFRSDLRINICFTDIAGFSDELIQDYHNVLIEWSSALLEVLKTGSLPQFNLLTDRIMLQEMRNCNAGVSTLTLAPDGRFFLCPAFFYEKDADVGNLDSGVQIPNKHLLDLEHAPLCRKCDAFHCLRCVWLNGKLTGDSNTPSHQQCVMSHVERNASRLLLNRIRKMGVDMKNERIDELDYLDPFYSEKR